jgi:alanyl-tRNA synthetase
MTERIYYTDAYCRRFDARVVAVADHGRRIELDATAFYPTSGGQPHDVGTLGGVEVVDVIDTGDGIAHVLAEPLTHPAADMAATAVTGAAADGAGADGAPGAGSAAVGMAVTGEIDWPRRFDHMQQHTGQHLLSAVFEDLFGWATASVHFGADGSTLDLDASPDEVRAALPAAEQRANELIAENRPVRVTFEDAAAAAAAGLRKPSERGGEIRVVSIDRVDRSACGGTHVRGTAEIGLVLIAGVERVRGQARVGFLCGRRVLHRARADRAALERIAAALACAPAEAPATVERVAAELRGRQAEARRLTADLAEYRAREMLAESAGAVRRVFDVRPGASPDELRSLSQAMSRQPRVLYVGASSDPPFVVFAASEDTGVDAGRTLREVLAAESGRGGGSPRAAQGTVADAAAVARIVARLREIGAGGMGAPRAH